MATVQTVKIQADIAWQARRSVTSNRWIGVCDALNLSMEADSLDELHSVIPEAIHLLMLDLVSDNELAQYLRERGWDADHIPAPDGDIAFDIPWYLIAEGSRDTERRSH